MCSGSGRDLTCLSVVESADTAATAAAAAAAAVAAKNCIVSSDC